MPSFPSGIILFSCAFESIALDKQSERKKYYWRKKGSGAKLRLMGVVFAFDSEIF